MLQSALSKLVLLSVPSRIRTLVLQSALSKLVLLSVLSKLVLQSVLSRIRTLVLLSVLSTRQSIRRLTKVDSWYSCRYTARTTCGPRAPDTKGSQQHGCRDGQWPTTLGMTSALNNSTKILRMEQMAPEQTAPEQHRVRDSRVFP